MKDKLYGRSKYVTKFPWEKIIKEFEKLNDGFLEYDEIFDVVRELVDKQIEKLYGKGRPKRG